MGYLKRFSVTILAIALGMTLVAIALVPATMALSGAGNGEPEAVDLSSLPERSLVYDSAGEVVATFHADQNRAQVKLADVPDTVKQSILAVEDENFYSHSGVNVRGILRAFVTNVEQGGVEQGGSTITMQVVKKLSKTAERDVSEKLRQAILARRLEDQLTKDQILEMYVNLVYFGNGAYGVQAAAETYFGKDVQQLSWSEGALLAALIRDPNGYDPFQHPDLAIEQRRIALQRLVETGKITQADADVDAFTPLPAVPATIGTDPSQTKDGPNAYFIEAVKQRLLTDPQYLGGEAQDRSNLVYEGGLRIYTTLDQGLQQKALQARNGALPDDDPNGLFTIYGARQDTAEACPALHDDTDHCKGTVAMVSVEPSTGAVREVVGGPGFANWRYDLATQARRQPGSSMKPYVLVTALEQGHSVYDTIDGSQCSFKNTGGTPDPYVVKGEGGVASLVTQTAGSVNCAFLRLGRIVGADKVIAQAKKMGVESQLTPNLSLPLGTSTITPLEQAGAYASIANDGMYNEPYFVEKVTDRDGKVLYEHKHDDTRVMSQQTSRQAIVALKAVVTGGTATRARLSDREAAGKTGTTEDHGDAWFVGFTPQLATAVWMGSPETVVPMSNVGGINVFGGTFPALVWHDFYVAAMDGVPSVDFSDPAPASKGSTYLSVPKGTESYSYSSSETSDDHASSSSSAGSSSSSSSSGPDQASSSQEPPPTTSPPPVFNPTVN